MIGDMTIFQQNYLVIFQKTCLEHLNTHLLAPYGHIEKNDIFYLLILRAAKVDNF